MEERMESHNLYRVKEEDLDRLIRILTVCFSEDPLYHALIPDRDTRERLMPELFTCDLTEFFETCEIYACLLYTSPWEFSVQPFSCKLTPWFTGSCDPSAVFVGSQLICQADPMRCV